jgi:hypothetical protein
MTENKQQRPILIASFSALFAAAEIFRAQEMSAWNSHAQFSGFRAQKSPESCGKPRPRTQFLPRVILKLHRAPVDITVDKGTPRTSEKAQQNQHFKYHRPVRYSYRSVNKPLTRLPAPEPTRPLRATPIVTLRWNMHRSRAACSLNVTNIGICLSRQHLRIYRNHANFTAEIARTVDWTRMQDYSDFDLWNARWPTSQGFFRGLHESA